MAKKPSKGKGAYEAFTSLAENLEGLRGVYLLLGILGLGVVLVLLAQALKGDDLNQLALLGFFAIVVLAVIFALTELRLDQRAAGDHCFSIDPQEATHLLESIIVKYAQPANEDEKNVRKRLVEIIQCITKLPVRVAKKPGADEDAADK